MLVFTELMAYSKNAMNGGSTVLLAIPITGDALTTRFGHCESYLFVTIDLEAKKVLKSETAVAPPHAPDHLPDWIVKQGANTLIAPVVPDRFRALLEFHGLTVIEHTEPADPMDLAQAFVDGELSPETEA